MPQLRTSDIGIQTDGTILMYIPTISQVALVPPQGTGGAEPDIVMGAAISVTPVSVLARGQWVYVPNGAGDAQQIDSDGTTKAPGAGKIYELHVV